MNLDSIPIDNIPMESSGVIETGEPVAVLLFLIVALGICAGIIALQIYLSKRESRLLGLIMPAVSFSFSLMALLGVLLYSAHSGTSTQWVNGEIVEQTTTQLASTASIIGGAVYIFVLFNIPTVILVAIYAACRNHKNKHRALDKMNVQDL